MPRLLAAPDKFRGTLTAPEAANAIARAAAGAGWDCDVAPISDGGEGFLDVFSRARDLTDRSGERPVGR